MAAEGLRVKVQVFTERNINHESMKDQAELMLYGNWRRHMWLTISAGITTLLIGLATVLKYKGQQLLCWWQGSKVSSFDGLSQSSSKGLLSHSSLESFARSNSSSNPASMRHLKGASNWSELSRYAGLLQLDVHTGSRIERTDLHICSKDGVPWVLGSGAYGIVYKAIRNGVQEVAIKILAAADDQQLHAFKKVSSGVEQIQSGYVLVLVLHISAAVHQLNCRQHGFTVYDDCQSLNLTLKSAVSGTDHWIHTTIPRNLTLSSHTKLSQHNIQGLFPSPWGVFFDQGQNLLSPLFLPSLSPWLWSVNCMHRRRLVGTPGPLPPLPSPPLQSHHAVIVLQEIAVLRSLSYDRNLVQFYGACLEREHAMLVLEYMEGGDLYQAIQENSYPLDTRLLSWYQKGGTIALDIAKGLVYLHQNNVRFHFNLVYLVKSVTPCVLD